MLLNLGKIKRKYFWFYLFDFDSIIFENTFVKGDLFHGVHPVHKI